MAKKAVAVEPVVEAPVKKAPAKKALKPVVLVQFQAAEYDVDEVVKQVKAEFKAAGHREAVTELNIYIKPEEAAVYYVVNGEVTGKIEL